MKKIFYLCFGLLLISSTCSKDEPCQASTTIINNSQKTIYFSSRAYNQLGDSPDLNSISYKISPNSIKKYGGANCEEKSFEETGKVYYFLFDEQVLLNNTWEDVVANDLVLKRYSFTLQEMQASNWTIIYDGN